MFKIWSFLLGIFVWVGSVQAQMPHEVLLLVNKNSQPSLLAANVFAAARQIPKMNMVYLNIPENAYGGTATVTPEEFTNLIWEPANTVAQERGIEGQILAWVYSVDFPIRVATDSSERKKMSVGGMTFVRNKPPELSLVEEGKYLSKLFGGPNERLKTSLSGLSLAMHKKGLGMDAQVPPEAAYLQGGLRERMPLPSMMLGYIGEKGSSIDTVLQTIQRGKISDHRGMRNNIYFVTSDNVRSTCREWQYAPALEELKRFGIESVVTTNFPVGVSQVMGIMMGSEKVDPATIKSFAPGAMAEHLTSWGAEFQRPQTKITRWLDAGATGTAGTVVEPYANPNKFPSARFFSYYASGGTMLESFYQSIACPLQILLLGDPLAKPYAMPLSVKVLGASSISTSFTYFTQAESRVQNASFLYSFFLDGKKMGEVTENPAFFVNIIRLADGYHELRAVARIKHLVEFNSSVVKPFTVDRMGRSVAIDPNIQKSGTYEHAIKVQMGGEEVPEKLQLVSGEQVLDEKKYEDGVELVLNEHLIGEGPNRIRAIAIYADGMEVSSPPISFGIKFSSET